MEIKLKAKEVDVAIKTAKLVSTLTGEELPSAWELMKKIAQNNDELLSVKPDLISGEVSINISEDYMEKGMNIYNEYLPNIYHTSMDLYNLCTGMLEEMEELAKSYKKPEEKEKAE